MAEPEDEFDESLLDIAKAKLLAPVQPFISRKAQRLYVRSFLLTAASTFLAILAILAYILFYYNFIPRTTFIRPIHLQFHANQHPAGSALIAPDFVSAQPYDVSVLLHLPRSPSNLALGNFMIDVALLASGDAARASGKDAVQGVVVAQASRPAILTYYSRGVEAARKLSRLPLYVTGLGYEAETLDVQIMERVWFGRGKGLPREVRLEIRSKELLEIYSAKVVFTARFGGIRWIMYNHRVLSFLGFTTAFWIVEMGTALLLWLFFSQYSASTNNTTTALAPKDQIKHNIKTEDEDISEGLSDTSRTFPTYARQPPLRYSSPPIKTEDMEEAEPSALGHPTTAEADDEDEEADFVLDTASVGLRPGVHSDSGIGTSMESTLEIMEPIRRRKAGGSDVKPLG